MRFTGQHVDFRFGTPGQRPAISVHVLPPQCIAASPSAGTYRINTPVSAGDIHMNRGSIIWVRVIPRRAVDLTTILGTKLSSPVARLDSRRLQERNGLSSTVDGDAGLSFGRPFWLFFVNYDKRWMVYTATILSQL
jgi:hypothetical protein